MFYLNGSKLLSARSNFSKIEYDRVATIDTFDSDDESEIEETSPQPEDKKTCIYILWIVSATICMILAYTIYVELQKQGDTADLLSNEFSINDMLPLDLYTHDIKVSKMKKCYRNDSMIMNNRLWHLKELDTTCSLGIEKCVISLSLWCKPGDRQSCEKYLQETQYIPMTAELYKGWEIWLYTDGTIPPDLLEDLRGSKLLTIKIVDDSLRGTGAWGMMWRLLPMFEPDVDRFITRDIDEHPMIRAWSTTYEWIRRNFSSLRWADHHLHKAYKWPIMGGTLGLTRASLTDSDRAELWKLYNDEPHAMHWADDQKWYRKHIWPRIKDNILSFDIFYCHIFDHSQPYPVPHSHCDYVMGASDEWFGHRGKCKGKCQHPDHDDWIYG